MYRPPMSSSTMRVEATRRAPAREDDVLRGQHRAHVAAERAKRREERAVAQTDGFRLTHPLAAFRAFVAIRR